MNPIGVQVVDDHPAIIELVEHILDKEKYEIRSKVTSIEAAIADSKQFQIDFVMLDLIFPRQLGETLVRHYVNEKHPTRMLIYSSTRDMYLPSRCIQAGAHGFLDKGAPLAKLIHAVDTVAIEHKSLIPPELKQYLERDAEGSQNLTPREIEVARLIALGLSSKMISSELDISDGTVNIHRTNLMRKLNAHSMPDVIRYALNTGLVSAEELHIENPLDSPGGESGK